MSPGAMPSPRSRVWRPHLVIIRSMRARGPCQVFYAEGLPQGGQLVGNRGRVPLEEGGEGDADGLAVLRSPEEGEGAADGVAYVWDGCCCRRCRTWWRPTRTMSATRGRPGCRSVPDWWRTRVSPGGLWRRLSAPTPATSRTRTRW